MNAAAAPSDISDSMFATSSSSVFVLLSPLLREPLRGVGEVKWDGSSRVHFYKLDGIIIINRYTEFFKAFVYRSPINIV